MRRRLSMFASSPSNPVNTTGVGGFVPGLGRNVITQGGNVGANANDFGTANRIFAMQFTTDAPLQVGHMSWLIVVASGTAGDKVDIGISDASGNLLVSLGGADANAVAGAKNNIPSQGAQFLPAGTYYLLWTFNGVGIATFSWGTIICSMVSAAFATLLNNNANRWGFLATVAVGGVIPATVNVTTGFTTQTTTSYPPYVLLEA